MIIRAIKYDKDSYKSTFTLWIFKLLSLLILQHLISMIIHYREVTEENVLMKKLLV